MDTRWWNLSVGVLATTAMSACGPTILLEGETDGSVTDSDGPDTVPPDTTPPLPPLECQSDSDCGTGFTCIDNACIPIDDDYYCQDGGCCYDECCYDGYGGDCYYSECYDDGECGFGSLCSDYGQCEPVDFLPRCEDVELTDLPLPSGEDDDEIVSLSFLDVDGDGAEDLLVGRASSTQLHMGGGEAEPVTVTLPEADDVLHDAVGGDFNGDGLTDLAMTDGANSMSILLGDGAGAFTPASTIPMVDPVLELLALDWNGDGALDLVSRTAGAAAVVHLGDGSGTLIAHLALADVEDARSIAAGPFYEGEAADVVVHHAGGGSIYLGNEANDVEPDLYLYSPHYDIDRRVMAVDFEGGGTAEIIGRSNIYDSWMLLEAWRDGGQTVTQYGLEMPADLSDIGDYDGDGILDLVLANREILSLVRGSPQDGFGPVVECQALIEPGVPISLLAVGDLDGDGRADMAVADGRELFVFTTL